MKDYEVLLYYKYVPIADPAAIRDEQERICRELELKGRILVAPEGINGTVSGLKAHTQAYRRLMEQHALFQGIEFKIDEHDAHTFLKLHVRVKKEIVRFEVEGLDVPQQAGPYVEPEEFRQVLRQAETDENILILDARSDYEHRVGKFKNALTLDIHNFRELPQKLPELEPHKGKKIYTYCTGGIKCEKVTAWMKQQGFEEVYQLHGGIVRYAKEVGGEDFEGSCYVFDQRVVVPVNEVNPRTVGHCRICDTPTEKMINCANPECNEHFLICESCAWQLDGCCSEACKAHPRKRKYDGTGYYLRGVNSKQYVNSSTGD
ncbi:MAG: rhodanese-related sulfurtransferase [Bacteroidetes bacterium]|nr:MAG: rhodanese-related sulfurtransferase [Bacteroidota bacterium]